MGGWSDWPRLSELGVELARVAPTQDALYADIDLALSWSERDLPERERTRHVSAVCINMPWKSQPQKIWNYRLRTDGEGNLVVRGPRGRALVTVDRQSFRVLSSVRNP